MTAAHVNPESAATNGYRAAVSLHSHTSHSQETLVFLERSLQRVPPAWRLLCASGLDLHRLFWTPPLAPRDAWQLERRNIEEKHGLAAMVSLTDHDDLEGPLSLRVLSESRNAPVSVEWTVNYARTFFHLGVHNLPAAQAREMMRSMAAVTAAPSDTGIAAMLAWINETPESLVVFNHPCWDEKGIGQDGHDSAVIRFAGQFGEFLHAVEFNGFRGALENERVFELSRTLGKPVVAGGDRHALEPNTVLNLTNAATLSEFVSEIRAAESRMLITPQYRKNMTIRVIRAIVETLHGVWPERCSYTCDDGVTRPLSELCVANTHAKLAVGAIECLRVSAARMLPAVC